MDNQNITAQLIQVILGGIVTGAAYLGYPNYLIKKQKELTATEIKRITRKNGIIVWIIFVVIKIILGDPQIQILPALFWSAIAKRILMDYCLVEEAVSKSEDNINNTLKETDNNVSAVTVASQSVITPTSLTQICQKCKREFDVDFAHCPYCGRKVRKKRSKRSTALIAAILVVLICVAGCFGYLYMENVRLEEIRDNAFTAMYDQKFSEAKYYFDQYPDVEDNFPSEYAYVLAGVVMEKGDYEVALRKFRDLAYPVPESVMTKVIDKVYSFGKTSYSSKAYSKAQRYFILVEDYKRSEDYVTLCKAHLSYSTNLYNELIRLIGFEDASEILLSNALYADRFLEGSWRTQNRSNYFIMYEDGSTKFNLPSPSHSGTYQIIGGVYRLTNKWAGAKDCFKFTVTGKDTISVYCYQNKKTYTLYRQ